MSPGEKLHVLVADDNRLFLYMVTSFLQTRGFHVLTANNGREARRVIEEHGPELVITDLIMPELDGLELCRFIRTSETVGFTYVVMLTAKSDPESLSAAFEAGADDFIAKPFNEQELLSRIRSAERIIRLESSYRRNAIQLHKANAEVAAANDRLMQVASQLTASNQSACIEKAEAVKASKEKSDFLANMSHELRSPMTAILGYAELLHSDGDLNRAPPERIQAVETILKNGHHLLDVINEVLELSKIDAGKLKIVPARCSPAQIIEDVRCLLQVRAEGKGLSLTSELEGKIPESIESDPARIRQILINLVSNAVKFTQRGCVRIVARHVQSRNATSLMEFDIIDTGIGLTKSQQSAIFNRFGQADNHDTATTGGTGLGLAISKNIAELLGGHIEVMSEPNHGSTFRLSIPTGDISQVAMIDKESLKTPVAVLAAEKTTASVRLDGIRVLLAEDNEDSQRLLSEFMHRSGVKVIVATDGSSAVSKALELEKAGNPVDMILMDRQMPKMSGVDATRELRKAGFRKPIIGLSAGVLPHETAEMLEAGCDGWESKPISHENLAQLISRWTQTKGGTEMTESTKGPIISELAGHADMAELVQEYVQGLPDKVTKLRSLLAAGDIESLACLAHKLKGSAGGYGFPMITEEAARLEKTAKANKDLEELEQCVRELSDMCSRAASKAP